MEPQPQQPTIPNLASLTISGPLSDDDVTYTVLKAKPKPEDEKFEQGFPIKNFIAQAETHDIWSEFKRLEDITFDRKIKERLCTDEDVKAFNRYSDILPYKHNPVTLPKDSYGENPYINASYVTSSIRGDDKSFVVCQSPLDTTIVDFWRMVIKEGVDTIVMLCKLTAGSRAQSCEYFPGASDRQFDGFNQVKLIGKTIDSDRDLTTRHFLIEYGTETRNVTHYQWEGWPDHGVPDEEHHPILMHLVKEIMDRRKPGHPIVIHCSAGIGRSGTLVALHNIAQIVQAYEKAKSEGANVDEEKARISVFSIVRRLREQRFGMVQTVAQYELIYELTKELVANPKLLQTS